MLQTDLDAANVYKKEITELEGLRARIEGCLQELIDMYPTSAVKTDLQTEKDALIASMDTAIDARIVALNTDITAI